MRNLPGHCDRRGGYTLIELLVVNILFALLVVLIAGAWRAFGPLCVEVIARGRIVNEANITAATIYMETNNHPQGLSLTMVEVKADGSLQFDYGLPASYHVHYYLTPTPDDSNSMGMLMRDDGSSSVAIARHVESAVALTLPTVGGTETSRVGFTVTFAYRGSRSQYSFEVHN